MARKLVDLTWGIAAWITILGFLSSITAEGADITPVVDQNPIKKNSFAIVGVAVEKGDQVSYQVFPNPVKRDVTGNKLYMSGVPWGKYTVIVTVVNFGEKPDKPETKGYKERFDQGQVEITVQGEDDGGEDDVVPPGPTPPPDVEAATLTSQVNAAFKREKEPDREALAGLQALYARFGSETKLAKYNTWGELVSAMADEARTDGVSGKLIETQTVIYDYLAPKLIGKEEGWETVAITATKKKAAVKAFTTVATALRKVK